jgi:multidrug efflux pump
MMRFTDIFIRRPVLAVVVSLLIFLIGLRAFLELQLRQFPMMTNTVITVTTTYPGASAELMQGFISTPVEHAVATIDGIDYLTSSSVQDRSTVTAYIRLNYDPGRAMTDVMAKVQQVKYQLPKEANDPVVTRTTGDAFGAMIMGFYGTMPSAAMYDHVNRVVIPLLATVPGVGQIDVYGGQPMAMRVWLNPSRMTARGVTAEDIATAIRANNFQSAPGQAKGQFVITNVTADTGLKSVEQFQDMVVKSEGGALVRLRDVAEVKLGGENYNITASFNGKNALVVPIALAPTGNPLEITKGVNALLPEIERGLPPGMSVDIPYDVSTFIKAAIKEVLRTLIETVLIVVLVIFLFLGSFRSVIIPIVTIPLSLIGAGVFMLVLGFSLNLLTLLAMVLAIGLVVDDAIVVVENVYRHIEEGETPFQAAMKGAREIVGPVIAMAITLAAVYAPIGFLTGLTGLIFREFAFTLAGTVIISGIVALTLSPMMSSLFMTREMTTGKFVHKIDEMFSRLATWYSGRLSAVLDQGRAVAIFIVGVFAVIAFMFSHTSKELAPIEDQSVMISVMKAPQYANIDYTTTYSRHAHEILTSYPEIDRYLTFVGKSGSTSGNFVMRLKNWDERKRSVQQLMPLLQKDISKVEGVSAFVFTFPPLPGTFGGMPVQAVISTPGDYKHLYETIEDLKGRARASGLFQVVDSDLTFNNPMIKLNIDRSKAHDLGVSMQNIGATLSTLVGENYTNRFSMEGRAYEVITQVPRAQRLTPEALTQFYVRTSGGQQVPLSTFVSISSDVTPNALNRYNQLNSATFSAVPMRGVSMNACVEFLKAQAAQLPRDIFTNFLGESRQFVQEGNKLLLTFLFALVIIYLVLAAQYESLRDPLVILISVPMSVCGAFLPLFFGITTLNIYTQIGLVTLIGLISKHGILMVSFARTKQIAEGCDRRTAIEQAAQVRLRPILMTTAAMVAGLLPLVFATGAGAASRFALGVVVVFGMTVGTMFTLFVLPYVYTVLATDHRAKATARAGMVEAPAE